MRSELAEERRQELAERPSRQPFARLDPIALPPRRDELVAAGREEAPDELVTAKAHLLPERLYERAPQLKPEPSLPRELVERALLLEPAQQKLQHRHLVPLTDLPGLYLLVRLLLQPPVWGLRAPRARRRKPLPIRVHHVGKQAPVTPLQHPRVVRIEPLAPLEDKDEREQLCPLLHEGRLRAEAADEELKGLRETTAELPQTVFKDEPIGQLSQEAPEGSE